MAKSKEAAWMEGVLQAFPVCPWCNHSHDISNSEGKRLSVGEEWDCKECGQPFRVYPSVVYVTEKA